MDTTTLENLKWALAGYAIMQLIFVFLMIQKVRRGPCWWRGHQFTAIADTLYPMGTAGMGSQYSGRLVLNECACGVQRAYRHFNGTLFKRRPVQLTLAMTMLNGAGILKKRWDLQEEIAKKREQFELKRLEKAEYPLITLRSSMPEMPKMSDMFRGALRSDPVEQTRRAIRQMTKQTTEIAVPEDQAEQHPLISSARLFESYGMDPATSGFVQVVDSSAGLLGQGPGGS